MSYKHNNLMAMRQNYWKDETSPNVQVEKQFFQYALTEHGVFDTATLDDARYFFFTLPSIIIVKGYALGFLDQTVKQMIFMYIEANKSELMKYHDVKIQFHM